MRRSGNTKILLHIIFQSTHPLRGATAFPASRSFPGTDFNPRTPCGVRLRLLGLGPEIKRFQSTHPLRGATWSRASCARTMKISIHAPLAGCDHLRRFCLKLHRISIHAPLAGCDAARYRRFRGRWISIHAPLAGCDVTTMPNDDRMSDFNPRTPCGVRQCKVFFVEDSKLFQSTHPLRGATFA